MSKKISETEIRKIRELDLLSYFKNYEPQELVKNSRNDYTTKTYSSLHMSNGLWTYWARGIGGRSALDFLIKVQGLGFREAATHIRDLIDSKAPDLAQHSCKTSRSFRLPYPSDNNNIAIRYLIDERYIDEEIVKYCCEKHLIYEDNKDHAVVFVGYDSSQLPRFACKRATDDIWKKDVYGSDKRYAFSISNDGKVVHIFESPIDLLSYLSLMKLKKKNWQAGNYLSLSGVTNPAQKIEDSTLPAALDHYLKSHDIDQIILHLDNDHAGKGATEKIIYLLHDYSVIDQTPYQKDINKELVFEKQRIGKTNRKKSSDFRGR